MTKQQRREHRQQQLRQQRLEREARWFMRKQSTATCQHQWYLRATPKQARIAQAQQLIASGRVRFTDIGEGSAVPAVLGGIAFDSFRDQGLSDEQIDRAIMQAIGMQREHEQRDSQRAALCSLENEGGHV